jgi:hypothetical protein
MPLSAPVLTFPLARVEALFPDESAELNINIPPSTTIVAGTILGQIDTAANDVQTITVGGTPTGGTSTISGVNPATGAAFTINPAYNATGATVQTALVAIYGAGNVTVTGSAGGPYVVTFLGKYAGQPAPVLTVSTTGLTGGTPTIANVHTTTGRSAGTFGVYADANSDGSGDAQFIMKYTVSSDSAGNIYFAPTAASEWGQSYPCCPAYYKGSFRSEELTGLDAAALVNLNGRLVSGSLSSGVVHIG